MIRSFRFQLAARVTAGVGVALFAMGGVTYMAMRASLDRQINASLINLASIQAASLTQPGSAKMEFHEWALTPAEAASVLDLNRYAQVWTAGGRSMLRTRYLTRDLPLDRAALREAMEGRLVSAEQRLGDIPVRSLYYPLVRLGPAHAHHVLEVAAPLVARNLTLERLRLLLISLILVAGAGSFAGSWWLAARVVRPVDEIIDQSEAIGAHTLGRRIQAYAGTQEYQRLVQVLNTMLERLDRAFDAQRRFTADASHELRSPLTALQGELELALRRERAPVEYRRVIASALEEAHRLGRTAEDLLTLARADAGVLRPRMRDGELATPVAHTCKRLQARAHGEEVRLTFRSRGSALVCTDPELVERLAYNLIENAIKYTPAGGEVVVEVEAGAGGALLRVADTGPGLPDAQIGRLFDRFFRADESRTPAGMVGGTGLGLSIAQAIAQAHEASITAANRAAGGAVFTVSFPVAAEAAEEGESAAADGARDRTIADGTPAAVGGGAGEIRLAAAAALTRLETHS